MTRAEAVKVLRRLREVIDMDVGGIEIRHDLTELDIHWATVDTALEIAVDDVTAAAVPLAPNKWVEARLAEERAAIRTEALEEAASIAESRPYQDHWVARGLAMRIRSLKTNTNPKQEGK